MDELIKSPWWSSLIILVTQIIFLYARTLNVMFTSEKKMIPALITGNIIGIAWLISIAIGANAILTMQWQPICAHIIGGSVGVIIGFKHKRK